MCGFTRKRGGRPDGRFIVPRWSSSHPTTASRVPHDSSFAGVFLSPVLTWVAGALSASFQFSRPPPPSDSNSQPSSSSQPVYRAVQHPALEGADVPTRQASSISLSSRAVGLSLGLPLCAVFSLCRGLYPWGRTFPVERRFLTQQNKGVNASPPKGRPPQRL